MARHLQIPLERLVEYLGLPAGERQVGLAGADQRRRPRTRRQGRLRQVASQIFGELGRPEQGEALGEVVLIIAGHLGERSAYPARAASAWRRR